VPSVRASSIPIALLRIIRFSSDVPSVQYVELRSLIALPPVYPVMTQSRTTCPHEFPQSTPIAEEPELPVIFMPTTLRFGEVEKADESRHRNAASLPLWVTVVASVPDPMMCTLRGTVTPAVNV
jgi:hypothetical protein